MNFPGLPATVTGLLVVHLAVGALVVRSRWQARHCPPVTEKLLRAPGERLRQRLHRLDERLHWLILGTTLLPLSVFALGLWLLPRATEADHGLAALIATFAVFLGLAAGGVWLLLRLFNQRRDARLALRGETAVAESLAPLVFSGYRVFHDVPTESGDALHNVHHVVIGPAGVFAIETQTHPRRKPIPGRKAHEIVFDGSQLVYPWGQDTQGLVPARKKAEWLADWLFQIVGERVPVSAVLTFPGWWVTPSGDRDVRVHNPGQIAALILESRQSSLSEQQTALIVRQLEARCRDVAF